MQPGTRIDFVAKSNIASIVDIIKNQAEFETTIILFTCEYFMFILFNDVMQRNNIGKEDLYFPVHIMDENSIDLRYNQKWSSFHLTSSN